MTRTRVRTHTSQRVADMLRTPRDLGDTVAAPDDEPMMECPHCSEIELPVTGGECLHCHGLAYF